MPGDQDYRIMSEARGNPKAPRQEFAVHMLNEGGKAKARAIADVLSHALNELEYIAGASGPREMAIVRTKMEEVGFFAKKAMAVDPANQVR